MVPKQDMSLQRTLYLNLGPFKRPCLQLLPSPQTQAPCMHCSLVLKCNSSPSYAIWTNSQSFLVFCVHSILFSPDTSNWGFLFERCSLPTHSCVGHRGKNGDRSEDGVFLQTQCCLESRVLPPQLKASSMRLILSP